MGSTPCIGRAAELAALARVLGDARDGRGGAALLVGEPGIGKSRLAHELADRAREEGLDVHWGRCWEAGGQPAYWPWRQVIRGIVRASDPLQLRRDLGRYGAELAELVPEIATEHDELPKLGELPGAQARFRLFDAVACFVAARSSRAPLMIVLEDLHAADHSSVELLDFVARQLSETSIALLCTYRDVDARVAGLGDLLGKVARNAETIPLAPLSREQVHALVLGLSEREPGSGELDRIVRASEGNPLFVEELVRSGTGTRMPDGIAAVQRERLSALPAPARELLESASVAGRELRVLVVAAALGHEPAAVRAAFETASEHHVITPAGVDRWRFTHILIREALYRELAPPRRFALHRAFASAIAAASMSGAEDAAMEIAHHLDQSGPEHAAEAVAAYRTAAARALRGSAHADAVSLLERALELAEACDASTRTRVLLELGEARIRAGEITQGQDAAAQAAELARADGDAAGVARAALAFGSVLHLSRTDERMVSLLRDALEGLGEREPRLRARCLARLAAALQPAADPSGPFAMAREAIALARDTKDQPTLLHTLRWAASALMDLEHPARRVDVNREHVRIARALGESADVLRGCARLAFDYAEMGEVFEADAVIEQHAAETRRAKHPFYDWQSAALRGMRAIMRADFEEAEQLNARARALVPHTQDANTHYYTLFQSFGLARARFDDERLREILAEPDMLAIITKFAPGPGRVLIGSGYAALEDAERVAQLLDGAAPEQLLFAHDPHLLTALVDCAFALEDPALAAVALGPALAMAGRNATWGLSCMVCDAPMERSAALCHAVLGELEAAGRQFDRAAERADGMGAPAMRARIDYEHAKVLVRAGAEPDRVGALVARARTSATSMSLRGLLHRLDGLGVAERTPVHTEAALHIESEGDGWLLRRGETSVRLKDSKGLQILARLVAEPGRELHVLDLSGQTPALDTGNAGEHLDARAIAAYKARVEDLREQLEEAEGRHDLARAERARTELEFLTAELSRGVGLGGRARAAGNAAERARVNVRKRIQHALGQIGSQAPALRRHLDQTLRTGVFCAYDP